MAMAIMALTSPGPRIATSVRASSREGKDRMTSITRMMTTSTTPRKKPATRPRITPATSAATTTKKPMASEKRAPKMTRESMSRPTSSVPKMNCQLPLLPRRRLQQVLAELLVRIVRRDPGRKDRHQHQRHEDDEADHGAAVLREIVPEFAQHLEPGAPLPDDGEGFDGRGAVVGQCYLVRMRGLIRA